MANLEDQLPGNRFGKLVVLHRNRKSNDHGAVKYDCQCDCGNIVKVSRIPLTYGLRYSCGKCNQVKPEGYVSCKGCKFDNATTGCVHPEKEEKGFWDRTDCYRSDGRGNYKTTCPSIGIKEHKLIENVRL